MQQCGDDEEFLHELLGDFKSEIETQLTSIDATIQVSARKSRFIFKEMDQLCVLCHLNCARY